MNNRYFIKNISKNILLTKTKVEKYWQPIYDNLNIEKFDIDVKTVDDFHFLLSNDLIKANDLFMSNDLFNQKEYNVIIAKLVDRNHSNILTVTNGLNIINNLYNIKVILNYITLEKEYRDLYFYENDENEYNLKFNLKNNEFVQAKLTFFNIEQFKYDLENLNKFNSINLSLPIYSKFKEHDNFKQIYIDALKDYNKAINLLEEKNINFSVSVDNINNYKQQSISKIKEIVKTRVNTSKEYISKNLNQNDCVFLVGSLYYDYIKKTFKNLNVLSVENVTFGDKFNQNEFLSFNDYMNTILKNETYQHFFIMTESFDKYNQDIFEYDCNYDYPVSVYIF